jgi:hypothetical protein
MSNIIKLDEVSYFPYDELADSPDWEYAFDVYIRLTTQAKAFEFNTGALEVASINRQMAETCLKFITFNSNSGGTHVINKKYIKWVSIHVESNPGYPEILLSEDGEVEARYSKLCKNHFTQNNVLWMLASTTEAENQQVFSDFSFLHSLGTRLTAKVSRAIIQFREQKADEYYDHLEDEDGSGYRQKFHESWGCRVYLNDGTEQFQPGISNPETIGGIFKGHALNKAEAEGMFLRLSDSAKNTQFMPMDDITMLECPTVFLGIDSYMRLHGKYRTQETTQNSRLTECRKLARV